MKRAGKKFNAIVVWPLIRKFILHVPHRRLRLLLGSWILATGVLSCNNDRISGNKKSIKSDSLKEDTASIASDTIIRDSVKTNEFQILTKSTCYDTGVPLIDDSELFSNSDSNIEVIPPKTCYAPVPDLNQVK